MTDAPQVIVVGSGPAGVSAAWPMVRAGMNVLMLDASNGEAAATPQSRPISEFRSDPQRWKDQFGVDLSALATIDDVSPKLSTPQARATLAGYGAQLGLVTSDFFAAGSLGRGGLSKVWGALAVPFDRDDLAGFPGAEDMDVSYRAVCRRIGVSGGPDCDAAAVVHAPSRALLTNYRRRAASPLTLYPAPNAVLDAHLDDRQACSQCGLCLYGCSRGSIYDSGRDVPALQRYANFSYRPGHVVQALDRDGAGHRIMVDVAGRRKYLRAPTVVLAAGTIATTDLVLRRLRLTDLPVRLLSNPAAAVAFVMPAYVGSDFSDRAFGLGQLFYRWRADDIDAAGVIYGADTLPLAQLAARMPVARPFALRLARALAPALLMTTCYVPGALSESTLRVEAIGGTRRVVIDGATTTAASAALRASIRSLKRAFLRLGAIAVPGSTTLLQPGADAHYAGTIPMRGAGPIATSAHGELKDCDNLFVADGASLPALPAAHPTLTIIANADRIGREIVRRRQSQAEPDRADMRELAS